MFKSLLVLQISIDASQKTFQRFAIQLPTRWKPREENIDGFGEKSRTKPSRNLSEDLLQPLFWHNFTRTEKPWSRQTLVTSHWAVSFPSSWENDWTPFHSTHESWTMPNGNMKFTTKSYWQSWKVSANANTTYWERTMRWRYTRTTRTCNTSSWPRSGTPGRSDGHNG